MHPRVVERRLYAGAVYVQRRARRAYLREFDRGLTGAQPLAEAQRVAIESTRREVFAQCAREEPEPLRDHLVDPIEAETPGAVGTYMRPAEPDSPFREMFFYNHGINLREVNEPLGAMLVKDGRVNAAALEAGLSVQKQEARTPIGHVTVVPGAANQFELRAPASGR